MIVYKLTKKIDDNNHHFYYRNSNNKNWRQEDKHKLGLDTLLRCYKQNNNNNNSDNNNNNNNNLREKSELKIGPLCRCYKGRRRHLNTMECLATAKSHPFGTN